MKPYQTLKQQTLAIAILFAISSLIGIYFFPAVNVILVTAPLAIVGVSWRLYRALHRQIGEQQFSEFRQLEALFGLYNTLDIEHPLPRTRHTAASPDFLHLLANEIFLNRPQSIVEVGSGTSTLVAAYCLKKLGRGKIISLDHLEQYADITRQTIKSHGLDDFAVVVHAPLREYVLNGASYQWYDDAAVEGVENIDLLIVDGPPHDASVRARYPAIPLLKEKLHKDSIILLDDGARQDETEIVAQWQQQYGLDYGAEPVEKGAFKCRFSEN